MVPVPKELTKECIARIVKAFADAAVRAVKAGIGVIEFHNAHGYLLQSFLRPINSVPILMVAASRTVSS